MIDLLLRQAKLTDSIKLFDLRNHPKVREYSHNTDKISFDEHKKWFEKTMLDDSKQIFIAQEKDDFVGMVRLELIDNACLMSWAIFPEFQGRRFGKVMVNMAAKTIDCTLKAEINNNNSASMKIADHIGMKLVKKIGSVLFYEK